ncbi:transporter substrate-binding domain-containing protein [Frigidibacter mobilis]|uniref:Octopine ABC transporter extracellular substrate-binding protein n=1 Tax=Frigidibacter mobilis TaxID=1335048 RepID=A0A159Z0A5_9RHOB|nr:transporter substrate-binding domain-containing protein [Frigidibacter mobilis]AMY67284.1 octopine ABC transporter extracellular substrate-binding protein [Frigidibacter mobilis]
MTVTRRTFVSTLAAGTGLLAAPGLLRAQARTIRFATEGAFPPFNQTAPSGAITGFEPDLIQALSERQGFEFELIAQAWDGMIQGLIDGKYDAVVDAVSVTPARQEAIDFSLPYTTGGSAFVTVNDTGLTLPQTGIKVDLADEAGAKPAIDAVAAALKGKTVAVQVSTIQSGFLDTYLAPQGVTVRAYQTGPDAYQDLLNGRADAVMASVTNLSAFLKKNEGKVAISGPTFGGGLMGNGAAIAIAKGSDLATMFNEGLKAMSDDGSLSELSAKWFGIDVTPKL